MSLVACICGSTRFKSAMLRTASTLTLNGYIVLMPNVFLHTDKIELSEGQKEALGALHLEKIIVADEIFIVSESPRFYIGTSTRREIAFAESLRKPVFYYMEDFA